MKHIHKMFSVVACILLVFYLSVSANAAIKFLFSTDELGYRCTGTGETSTTEASATMKASAITGKAQIGDPYVQISVYLDYNGIGVGSAMQNVSGTKLTVTAKSGSSTYVTYMRFNFSGKDLGQYEIEQD